MKNPVLRDRAVHEKRQRRHRKKRSRQPGSERDAARQLLVVAAAGFDRVDLQLYAAAARRRLGGLTGGDEGRQLVLQADDAMRSRGIPRPDRVADVLAPGFVA